MKSIQTHTQAHIRICVYNLISVYQTEDSPCPTCFSKETETTH